MKVYLAASTKGQSKYGEYYSRIFNHIHKLGHKHLDDSIVNEKPEDFYGAIKKEGSKKYEEMFNEALRKMRESDVNIFECSEQSFTIGYLVQKSLDLNKPTLALFEENHQPSYFLMGSQDEKLIIQSYNKENIEKVIDTCLDTAVNVADKRFNFFITPSLLAFLNQAAREQGITKSTLIRNLILEHRRKNSR